MSKILVTGGAGFIGSHLVDALVQKKHQVIVVDDLSCGKRININKKAIFFKLDIRSHQLEKIFKKFKPEIVFHLAAQKSIKRSVFDPAGDADINILGSINLFENSRKTRVRKVIFSSTGGAIYGDTTKIPTRENHLERPVSPYGVAKLAIEKYLFFYQSVYGLSGVILRYANIYGPRQDPEGEAGVVAIFMDRILGNEQPYVNGHGRQTRDYVYVTDAIKANLLAISKKVSGIFNISTSRETSVNDLYDKISIISGTKFVRKNKPALAGEQQRSCLDYKKSQKAIGWKPNIQLDRGLNLTWQWFKERYGKK